MSSELFTPYHLYLLNKKFDSYVCILQDDIKEIRRLEKVLRTFT